MVTLALTSLFELELAKKFLDFSHLRCPMAFVKSKQALLALEGDLVVQIKLADQASIEDILLWAQNQRLQCLQNQTDNGVVLEFSRFSLPQ